MAFLDAIANFVRDSGTIASSDRITHRLSTWGTYSRLTKNLISRKRFGSKVPAREHIGPHLVHYIDYDMLFSLWREIFLEAPYFFDTKKKQPVILDVGGNIGLATLYFKQLHPIARITTFEPDKRAFATLEANVKDNGLADVEIVNKAAHDHDGVLTWYFDEDKPQSLSMSTVKRETLSKSMEVPCVRLSGFVNGEVDFAKIDVEGAEWTVLQELFESGKMSQIRQLCIEYHPWCGKPIADLVKALEGEGFKVHLDHQRPESINLIHAVRP